ncbi:MAG: uracil phosphoribosyltransferase [Cyanobacteria bacterium K_DeepCast_35m_m2_023]|nr:uracil phosphoribosyltransferase [Cyanobacteria bacterium K_DeepCast_35m_m2_023]
MAMALRVVVPPHPLISHWLTVLRDPQTPAPLFGSAMAELGRWLTYEALRDWLPQRDVSLETPHGSIQAQVVDPAVPLLAITALPTAIGLWQGAQAVLPAAQLGHVVVADGSLQLQSLPDPIASRCGVLLFWSELAEPEPLLLLLDRLAERGVSGQRLRLITTLVAAPALHELGQRHEALTLYTAGIDQDLDELGRIRPGLGSLASRLLGFEQPN